MAEYIEREAVLEFVEPDARPFLAERIKSIPAADVRPVVLCRDCKHWELSKMAPSLHVCTYLCGVSFVRNAEDFCSRAVKRWRKADETLST